MVVLIARRIFERLTFNMLVPGSMFWELSMYLVCTGSKVSKILLGWLSVFQFVTIVSRPSIFRTLLHMFSAAAAATAIV